MSMFGTYYTRRMLEQMGWPRRRSILNSQAVIDTTIVDAVIDHMVDWAACVGACLPKQAVQMIAWIQRDKDWEGSDAPQILVFIRGMAEKWNVSDNTKAPHDVLEPIRLSKHFNKVVPAKGLEDKRIMNALETHCFEGLLWGLSHPDEFVSWYRADENRKRERLPMMQRAGVEIDSYPTLTEYIQECEAMLAEYERECDPLPEIPKKLKEDAETLGRKIDE